jgi:crotonobetainyl-CoA:carnitine CoA-transferase CaiB-like acyl-CoA transferase
MMSGPLDGITVVSVEQAVAAPCTSSRLADAGARVIKIERPEGYFARNYVVGGRALTSFGLIAANGLSALTCAASRTGSFSIA